MKPSTKSTNRHFLLRWNLPVLLFFISLTIALASGILLFNAAVIGGLSSTIINVGLDPSRSQLIAVLIMTATTALAGAFIGRSKLGALLGHGLSSCSAIYLVLFSTKRNPLMIQEGTWNLWW